MLYKEWHADEGVDSRIPAGTRQKLTMILSSTLKYKYITCQMIVEPLVICAL